MGVLWVEKKINNGFLNSKQLIIPKELWKMPWNTSDNFTPTFIIRTRLQIKPQSGTGLIMVLIMGLLLL